MNESKNATFLNLVSPHSQVGNISGFQKPLRVIFSPPISEVLLNLSKSS